MGLWGTIDAATPTLQRIAPSVTKLIDKMHFEVATLVEAPNGNVTEFQRRKFVVKIQTLVDTFETRARKSGIGKGRDNFELQTDVLFNRMNRYHAA
jgi:DNA helicase TIP49 (TBP-interacting protein)